MLSESGGNITLNANEIDINRISTDGAVIYLRKDGTTVGSISVTSAGTTYNTTGNAIELKVYILTVKLQDFIMMLYILEVAYVSVL